MSRLSSLTAKSPSFRFAGLLFLGMGILSACELDYPTTTWEDQAYDHVALSDGFELTGPHVAASCDGCHAAGNYELIYEPAGNQDCQACHTGQFESQHAGQGYPNTCLTCHNGAIWERGPFNHETESGGFALFGAHTSLECGACHVPGTFAPRWTPSSNQDCAACHA